MFDLAGYKRYISHQVQHLAKKFGDRISNIIRVEVDILQKATRFKVMTKSLLYFMNLAVSVAIISVHMLRVG